MAQKNLPVIDLHCDLLSYLIEKPGRTAFDPPSRASIPHLQQGNVATQVLAIYAPPGGYEATRKQVQQFIALQKEHPLQVDLYSHDKILTSSKVQILAAFESSAGFCRDTETVDVALKELEEMRKKLGPIAYISLTWDGENRYGGGVGAKVGLKEDGKRLLEWMNNKHIPIDVSHASDYLIDDILNTIDKKDYTLPVIASHSNFRAISPWPRNLPDEFAQEIIRRNGLIGLNFFCHFSGGKQAADLLKHIEHAMMLGAQNTLCLGADFFGDADFPHIKTKYNSDKCFYEELGNSSCYPYFFDMVRAGMKAQEDLIEKIAHKNAASIYQSVFSKQAAFAS